MFITMNIVLFLTVNIHLWLLTHQHLESYLTLSKCSHITLSVHADLPIVGGSILTHEHFQGGRYNFALNKADVEEKFSVSGYENVECGIVKWPMSVIRLTGEDTDSLIKLSEHILNKWRNYTDEDSFIFAETDGERHSTITPIVFTKNGKYVIDLVLRNNITTEEHPLGVFHPHKNLHHIKKENIGLIEVMGLAVLPSRLKKEMAMLKDAILKGKDISGIEEISKHTDWVNEFTEKYSSINEENIDEILHQEIGEVFLNVLKDAGVFKRNESGKKAFKKFIETL
jgi:UDPglucose--hexose-1-phosphate uridylyltransferase